MPDHSRSAIRPAPVIACVVSRYPAVSHAFIQSEVIALRDRGFRVQTVTVRASDRSQLLSRSDRSEAASTFAILPTSSPRLVRALGSALAHNPRGVVRLAGHALAAGRAAPRETLWQLFYAAESIILWDYCMRSEVRHLHAHFADVASDVAMGVTVLGGEGWSWTFTAHGSADFFETKGRRLAQKARSARGVVCISDHGRSQLMRLRPPDDWPYLVVVHCGVDTDLFAPQDRSDGVPGRFRITCVARLVSGKGHEILLEALARLRGRGIDATLDLIGDGDQRDQIQREAVAKGVAPHVSLSGALDQAGVRAHLASSDVMALPSFAEGIPVTLIEAMAMGIPVIGTDIAGVPELIEDGVSGLLVRPGRVDELADAFESIALLDRAGRLRMGEAGRRRVLQSFDIRESARRLEEFFLTVAGVPAMTETR